MLEAKLDTTNLMLGILAAVSVLQALVIVALGFMGYRAYARAMQLIRDVEQRQIAPLVARVNGLMATVDGILADVKGITARVGAQTERVDSAIRSTIDRVDETADRVRTSVGSRIKQMVGFIHGVRAAVQTIFNGRSERQSTGAHGHA